MAPTLVEEFKRSWLTSLIGILIMGAGTLLITWNEGRVVRIAHSFSEAINKVIAVNPFEPVRPELDGHLVHVSGQLEIDEPVTEPDYGISILAVKLKRRVQMYQWVEEEKQRDPPGENAEFAGDYYYVTEWRDKLVDSSSFYIRPGHQNPTKMPLTTYVHVSPAVRVGQIQLGTEVKQKFDDYTEVTGDERPDRKDIKLHAGIYYHCDDVWNPEVGDIRVQFYYAGLATESVSIVAMQKDGVLVPYKTNKGDEIAFLRHGSLNIIQMFNAEHSDLNFETWECRFLGVVVLYIGSLPLSKLIRIILYHGGMFRTVATSDSSVFLNFIFAYSIGLFVIATAWMAYRPWLAMSMLVASLGPVAYLPCSVLRILNRTHNP